jgi:hypothetical protein
VEAGSHQPWTLLPAVHMQREAMYFTLTPTSNAETSPISRGDRWLPRALSGEVPRRKELTRSLAAEPYLGRKPPSRVRGAVAQPYRRLVAPKPKQGRSRCLFRVSVPADRRGERG